MKKGLSMTETESKYHYLNKIACESEVYLQIMAPTKAVRLKTRLIGVDPNMSVLISMGNSAEWIAAKEHIREGQKVIVRIMSTALPDANLLAFQTKIQKVMSVAGRWMLLDYPQEVQQAPLRQDQRLSMRIEASLLDPESKKVCSTGFLSDLSINGCAFVGDPIEKSKALKKYLLQLSSENDNKSILMVVKNSKKADALGNSMLYGGALEGDAKKFAEPLLIDSLLG